MDALAAIVNPWQHKEVLQPGANLPEGTRIGGLRNGNDMTFAFPIDGDRNGWIALLRFMAQDSGVDLVAFEVTHYSDPEMPKADPRFVALVSADRDIEAEIESLNDLAFREWVQSRAERPAPVGVPAGGLTLRRLRGIRMAAFQTEARSYLAGASSPGGWLGDRWATDAVRRPGRKGKGDLHYAELAAAYCRHLGEGHSPIDALAKEQNLSKVTIRNQIGEARRRGLLSKTRPGVAGGSLTPKANALLEGVPK